MKTTAAGDQSLMRSHSSAIVIQFPDRPVENLQGPEISGRRAKVRVHQFLPKADRQAISHAFYELGRNVRWLAKMARVREAVIEEIIRSHHDDKVGELNGAVFESTMRPPTGPAMIRRAA